MKRMWGLLAALTLLGATAAPPTLIVVGASAFTPVTADRGIALVTVVYVDGARAGRGTEPIAARVAVVRAGLIAKGIPPSAIRTRVQIDPEGSPGSPNGRDEPYGVLEVDFLPSMLTTPEATYLAWQDLFAQQDGIDARLRVYRVLDDCSRARDASYRAAVADATNASAVFLESLGMSSKTSPLVVQPPRPDPSTVPLRPLMLCGRTARPPQQPYWKTNGDLLDPYDAVRIPEYATVVRSSSAFPMPPQPSTLAAVSSDVDMPAYGTARGRIRIGGPFVYAIGTLQGSDAPGAVRMGIARASRLARDLGASVDGIAALVAYRQNNVAANGTPVPRRFFFPPDGTSVGVVLRVTAAARPPAADRSTVRDVPVALMGYFDRVEAPFALDGARVATVETDVPADDEDVGAVIAGPMDAAARASLTAAAERVGFHAIPGNGAPRISGSVARPTDESLAAITGTIVASVPSGTPITWIVRPHVNDCFALEDRLRPVALAEALGDDARPHAVVAGALHVVRGSCGLMRTDRSYDLMLYFAAATLPLPWTVTARLSVLVQPQRR